MTQDEIIRMAREAGLPPSGGIVKFAALIAAHEREKQAEQESVLAPVRRGSRITCIESGEKCVVWATSHTDCWVLFPDGHGGQYTYEQIGKYFSMEENQAADEAYERGLKEGIEAGKKMAAHASTKDLTDDEIVAVHDKFRCQPRDFARAVIAADREKNK